MTEVKKTPFLKRGDMTAGNPFKVIILFALPILLGNLFQQFYNLADMRISGESLGEDALAAISATGSIYGVIIGMANGMNNGSAIVVTRLFGAKNMERMRKAVAHMLLINLATAVIFTALGLLLLDPLMGLIDVPEALYGEAYSYISIIIGGIITTILYNMGASVLRAVGDSRTPLVFLIFTSLLNVGLDLIFVKILGMNVGGIALATVCAQAVSVVLVFSYILKKRPELHVKKGDFRFEASLFSELALMGLSMGLISSLVSLGSFALQRAINGFDKATITATGAARRLDGLFMLPLSTLGTAAATFVGQNYGAKRYERITAGIKSTLVAGSLWSALGVAVIYLFGAELAEMLTASTDEQIISRAVTYMRINLPFFFVLNLLFVFRSSLQGLGKKAVPIISGAIELVLKFVAATLFAPYLGYVGICIAEPVIWFVSAVVVTAVFVLDLRKLRLEQEAL